MTAAPLVTLGLTGPAESAAVTAHLVRQIPSAATAVLRLPEPVRATVSGTSGGQLLTWAVMLWFAGVVVLWARLMGGWVVASRMRSMLVRPAPREWQQALEKLAVRIQLFRPVRLLVSSLVQVPTVVGWLRPVVLVPIGALTGLPTEHLEALLVHELAHIRRHDYLVNILQSVAEALLFYHPAVWWVSTHIRAERELCCDDLAVSVSGDVLTYAQALAGLESFRPAHLDAAIAANGGLLSDRE
jgi:beta-lactamase regulating signal transducer with metallopeptidase domain